MPSPAVPVPTPLTLPYWDGCRRGELVLQECLDCRRALFPPSTVCPRCLGERLEWKAVSGQATLYSYTIQHRPAPGFADRVPYTVAIVELAEGPRMMTNIVGIEPDPAVLEIDMPLEVTFEARGAEVGSVMLPVFRRAGSGS